MVAVQYVQNVQKDSSFFRLLNNLNVLNMGAHSEHSGISVAVFSYLLPVIAGKCCGVLLNTFKMFKNGSHLSCFEHSEHFEQGAGAD